KVLEIDSWVQTVCGLSNFQRLCEADKWATGAGFTVTHCSVDLVHRAVDRRSRGPCATHGTGRRGHSTPREHEEAGSTRRGLRLRASAGPAVELLGSAELWVVQELAGTETAVQVQPVLAGAELLEVPQELAGGELVVQGVLAAAVLREQRVLAPAALGHVLRDVTLEYGEVVLVHRVRVVTAGV
ncbi:hypothetical protein EJB05_05208, partial [Eragrostis curvula]